LNTSHGLGDVVFKETAVGLENFGSFLVQRIFSVGFLKFIDRQPPIPAKRRSKLTRNKY
jgi:hypothetical protein